MNHPIAPLPSSAASAGVPAKWLWAAIGTLAVAVAALGTTMAVQWSRQGPSALPDATMNSLAPADGGAALQPIAGQPSTATAGRPQPAPSRPQALAAAPAMAPQPVPQAVQPVRAAAVCATCGRVESVEAVQQAAPATGVGAVAGGVLGGVLGNQIGRGNGRAAATVLGAVGGGYVGHQVEKNVRTHTVYQVHVRMDDGSLRRFTRAQPVAVGTPIVLEGKGFRTASESPAAAPVQVSNGV